jgi:hypothetical protein
VPSGGSPGGVPSGIPLPSDGASGRELSSPLGWKPAAPVSVTGLFSVSVAVVCVFAQAPNTAAISNTHRMTLKIFFMRIPSFDSIQKASSFMTASYSMNLSGT